MAETLIKETPIIQIYSPDLWHGSAAIVVNEAGRKLLTDLLKRQGEIRTGEAFVSDGEGFTLGIIEVGSKEGDVDGINELQKYRTPYTERLDREKDLIDPREMIDEKEVLDKAEFNPERDTSGA